MLTTRPLGRDVLCIACVAAVGAMALLAGVANGTTTGPSGSVAAGKLTPKQKRLKTLGIGAPSKANCDGRKYTIGWSFYSDTANFPLAVWEAAKVAAKKLGCVQLVQGVDKNDPAVGANVASSFVQRKVDAAIIYSFDAVTQGMAKILTRAGIPYVRVGDGVNPGSVTIGVSEYNAGFLTGKTLARTFGRTYAGEVPYAVIGRIDIGGPAAIRRMNGVVNGIKSVLKALPDDHILQIDTTADPAVAQAGTVNVMSRIPRGKKILIVGWNDGNTFGMFQGAKQAGRASDVMVMAMGGAKPDGLDILCANPEYVGATGYFPENYANYMIPTAMAMARGVKKLPPYVATAVKVITRANVTKLVPGYACKG